MAGCVSAPTLTLYSTALSESTSVSFSEAISVITAPPTTQTVFSTVCVETVTDGTGSSCASFSTDTIISTIAGSEVTSSTLVPVLTQTFTITNTIPTQTLYDTCTTDPSSTTTTPDTNSSTPHNNPTPTPTPSPTRALPTSTRAVSLGKPTVYTSVVTVTVGGHVTTAASVVTTTPTLSPPLTGATASHNNLGLIIGGVVGGIFGLGFLIGIIWFFWRRRNSRWDDIFDDTDADQAPRRNLNLLDSEPKPYEYGVVGTSSPTTPQFPMSQNTAHNRTPSTAPLLLSQGRPNVSMDGMPNDVLSFGPSIRSSQTSDSMYQHGYPPQSPPFMAAGNAFAVNQQQAPSVVSTNRVPSHSSRYSSQSGSSKGGFHSRSPSIGVVANQQYTVDQYGRVVSPPMMSVGELPENNAQPIQMQRPQSFTANQFSPTGGYPQASPPLQQQQYPNQFSAIEGYQVSTPQQQQQHPNQVSSVDGYPQVSQPMQQQQYPGQFSSDGGYIQTSPPPQQQYPQPQPLIAQPTGAAPPAYEAALSSHPSSSTGDEFNPSSMHGQLATANPDVYGQMLPGSSSEKSNFR